MNKQNSKHIKTIQKKNKQYDDGGNLLSTIGGTVGSTIGSAITTSLDDGRHTGIGDFLIGASPLAGTLAVQALNNKSNKKINKLKLTELLIIRFPNLSFKFTTLLY